MDLLEDLRISLCNDYVIRKMLVLLKNHLSYLIDNIFKCFFKNYNKLLFFKKINFFHNI